jgi:hypothetical protein
LPACCLNLRGVGTDRNQRIGRIAGQQPQQKKQDERSDNDRQDQNGRAANKIGKYDAYLSSMSYRLPVRSSADISQFAADHFLIQDQRITANAATPPENNSGGVPCRV